MATVARGARWLLVRIVALLARLATRPPGPLRSVVVVEPGHLGDALLLTPALAALRQALPEARITVVAGPWAEALLARNPNLDAFVALPFPGFVRDERLRPWQPYVALWRWARTLRQARYDAAIIARDDHWWGALGAALAGIPRRVGANHPLVRPALSAAIPYQPTDHVTEQRLALVALLAGAPVPAAPTLFVPSAADEAWADAWLAEQALHQPLVAIQPGSGGPAKLWLPERWALVGAALAPTHALVVCGGPADAAAVEAVSAALTAQGTPHRVLLGGASLGELAALFGRCAAVLGVDNGPLHLAVARDRPTVHLFGPGDAARFGPWGDAARQQVVRAELWCAPCGVLTHCPRGTAPSECMALISTDAVVAAAEQALAQ